MTIDHDAIAARVRQNREAGTPGPWALSASGYNVMRGKTAATVAVAQPSDFSLSDARRISALPDLEAAYLALYDEVKRLRALPVAEPAPVAVRVKPLVAGRHPRGFIATDHGGGGAYIFALNGGRYECIKGLAHSPRFDTSKEALAAAQADHAARVLSQIDAVPAAQVRAAALEEAAKLPPYDCDGDPAGSFDHHVFVKRDAIRALIEKEQT